MFFSRLAPHDYLDTDFPRFESRPEVLADQPKPQLKDGRFSVVSFNIHFGYEPEAVLATLQGNGMAEADVLLLQESDDRSAQFLAEGLRMRYVYFPATVHPTSDRLFGVAVLTRWPITSARKILLPDKSFFDAARKVAMSAVVEIGGVPIDLVSVHLQSGMLRGGYKDQLASLLRCVTENRCEGDARQKVRVGNRPMIVAGDFNTWENGLERILDDAMARVPLKRVDGIADTFTKLQSGKGLRTLDYFFVSSGLYLKPGRVGESRTGSDHFPIAAEFRLP